MNNKNKTTNQKYWKKLKKKMKKNEERFKENQVNLKLKQNDLNGLATGS